MKKKFFILGIAALLSTDYAKSQACGTAIMGPASNTPNQVPVFSTSGGCVLNGIITDNATSVGIGTTSPSSWAKLHVAGGSISQARNEMSTWLTNNSAGGETDFMHNAYYSSGWKYILTDFASRMQQENGNIRFFTSASGSANNTITWSEKFTVLQGGNVGIGTTSPVSLLSNTSTSFSGGGATDGFMWRSLQNDWAAVIVAAPASGSGYGLRLHTNGTAASDYPFIVSSGSGSGTVNFAITGQGRVGIGTTSPSKSLDVNGDINIAQGKAYYLDNNKILWYNSSETTNIFCGVGAGTNISTGNGKNNTFIGHMAGNQTRLSKRNTAVGDSAYYSSETYPIANSAENDNTAIGYNAMNKSNGAYENTAVGSKALYSNVNGMEETAIGFQALYNCVGSNGYPFTGWENTAVGRDALYSNTSGRGNSALGDDVMAFLISGDHNIGIGSEALENNQYGSNNTAVGYQAGIGVSTTTHSNNSFFGCQAGLGITSGEDNVFMGYHAGYANTTGSYNVFIGREAGVANTTASNTSDFANVFVGMLSGSANTTGKGNTCLGYKSGITLTTYGENTCLGQGADVSTNAVSITNATAVGYGASVNASNKIVLGNSAATTVGGYGNWNNWSDGRFKTNIKENVPGLVFIKKLRPVTYNLEARKIEKFLGKSDSVIENLKDSYDKAEQIIRTGFIAQEVDSISKQIGYDFDGVYKPQNSKDNFGLAYGEFVVPLVKAVQEQQKMIDSLRASVDSLKAAKSQGFRTNQHNGKSDTTLQVKLSLPEEISLSEARPNPNNGKAEIDYYLPSFVNSAKIIFTDILGRIVNETKLIVGYGTISVDTQDLPSGTYVFSLIIDGKIFDSKKMVRSK